MNHTERSKVYLVIGIIVLIIAFAEIALIVFNVSYPEQTLPVLNEEEAQQIMEQQMNNFLMGAFSENYLINRITSKGWYHKIENDKIESLVTISMNITNMNTDLDLVPYLKEMKDNIAAETDPEQKAVLEKQYQAAVEAYKSPSDTVFAFKIMADISEGKVKEDSIKLLLQHDLDDGMLVYIPVEELFGTMTQE